MKNDTYEQVEKIFHDYQGTENLELESELNLRTESPDIVLHTYDTKDGKIVHFLEIDFVESLGAIKNLFKTLLGRDVELLVLKNPLKYFEESVPYKSAKVYKVPEDADKVLQHAHSGGITAPYYFCFVALGELGDRVSLQ